MAMIGFKSKWPDSDVHSQEKCPLGAACPGSSLLDFNFGKLPFMFVFLFVHFGSFL